MDAAGSAQPSILPGILSRINAAVGAAADIASGLNNQADRLIGMAPSPAPEGMSTDNSKSLGEPPLATQINNAIRELRRQLERAQAGSSRLSELG